MSEIDYALAWDFIDSADGKPRQLRFRRNFAPATTRASSTGPDNSSPWSQTDIAATTR